ncbi:MAG: universal stress protein [Leptolyngbya sp. SIO1D8]|nr:universal stress protein [Leptolyngbya sp. SIO1D8]
MGIITQTDLGDATQSATSNLQLQDIMTPHPVTVSPEASLLQVLDLLNRLKISRLPVTEGHRLVGIITRGDIIRAESERIGGETQEVGPVSLPSCGIYRTRAPATGRGRLLVPLSDPVSAPLLLELAIAIARQEQYELECVHVILVPRTLLPEEAPVDLAQSKHLLTYAEKVVQGTEVSLHTQIRVAHDVAPTLLEVIKKRHIDLVLLGWRRPTLTPGRVLGTVVDTLLKQAPCPVIAVKPGQTGSFNRWLVPSAGGPNAKMAMKLLPALMMLGKNSHLHLCAIASNQAEKKRRRQQLLRRAGTLERYLNKTVKTRMVFSENIAEAIVHLSQQYQSDVIMLGASREGLFSHVIKGNIPLEIAHSSRATILLVQHTTFNTSPIDPSTGQLESKEE